MSRFSRTKGLSVVTVAEGKKVGTVDDLYVDGSGGRIRWLRLSSGSFFGGDTRLVPTEAISGMGGDVITIRSDDQIRSAKDVPEIKSMTAAGQKLIGNKVVSEDGRYLGEVRDIEFDQDTYMLTTLFLRQGNAIGGKLVDIPADRILTFGVNAIMVDKGMVLSTGMEQHEEMKGDTDGFASTAPRYDSTTSPASPVAPDTVPSEPVHQTSSYAPTPADADEESFEDRTKMRSGTMSGQHDDIPAPREMRGEDLPGSSMRSEPGTPRTYAPRDGDAIDEDRDRPLP